MSRAGSKVLLVLLCVTSVLSNGINTNSDFPTRQNAEMEVATNRDGKLLPIFSVVTFPNDLCVGTESGATRNGTCYTSAECDSKGGTASGSCASGFGVCCVFALACGASASENHTYLVQASATTGFTSPCTYKICKCSSDICRIRFDFETFQIANPQVGTAIDTVVASAEFAGDIIGDCITDGFTVSGQPGGPLICGKNTGQHMIIDAVDGCHTANFHIGGSTTTRVWTIHITQYTCAEDDNSSAGPPGCLQWHRGSTGRITSFGLDRTLTAITASVTHLSSQIYQICIRRESGYCTICYTPRLEGIAAAVATQVSFGLSIGTAAISDSSVDEYCHSDRIQIVGKDTSANALLTTISLAAGGGSYVCGRYIETVQAETAGITICTRQIPFRVGVVFDANEISDNDGTYAPTANEVEEMDAPSGIVGFDLYYIQGSC